MPASRRDAEPISGHEVEDRRRLLLFEARGAGDDEHPLVGLLVVPVPGG